MTPRMPFTPVLNGPDSTAAASRFAMDVQYYLTQTPRQLPSRYLYDALGSALFDAICRLPWYPITRAEERLLARHGADIFRLAAPVTTIAELGPGNGEKLTILIRRREARASSLSVHLIDLSPSALEAAGGRLAGLGPVHVTTHEAGYEAGLQDVARLRQLGDRMLVLFLGSNIGNFDPPGTHAFLRAIRGRLRSGDALLIGADLVKRERDLRLAYDDPLGVTAAFNRNLLVRMNRELRANFDVNGFAHRALWNVKESRIEMHLIATYPQHIRIEAAGLELTIEQDEPIWTESSYKYEADQVIELLERAGFRPVAQWIDESDRFALTLVELA